MEMEFKSISEDVPGVKWRAAFRALWPAYRTWFLRNGGVDGTTLKTAQRALGSFMPELVPTYERLLDIVDDEPTAARFLTCFRPPAYLTGCSQMALASPGSKVLVRNYDLDPARNDGMIMRTKWTGGAVIAASEFLWGVADGMNDKGLTLSLAYGGRRIVGEGFGVPLILRYMLEVCADVADAIEVFRRIPSHMAYNITLLDRRGTARTVQIAPDGSLKICDLAIAANHQGVPEDAAYARFTRTIERESFLRTLASKKNLKPRKLIDAFLRHPLHSSRYNEGFGTLYTAAYFPATGTVQYHWPQIVISQSFVKFNERSDVITLCGKPQTDARLFKNERKKSEAARSQDSIAPRNPNVRFCHADWTVHSHWAANAGWAEWGAQIAQYYSGQASSVAVESVVEDIWRRSAQGDRRRYPITSLAPAFVQQT